MLSLQNYKEASDSLFSDSSIKNKTLTQKLVYAFLYLWLEKKIKEHEIPKNKKNKKKLKQNKINVMRIENPVIDNDKKWIVFSESPKNKIVGAFVGELEAKRHAQELTKGTFKKYFVCKITYSYEPCFKECNIK